MTVAVNMQWGLGLPILVFPQLDTSHFGSVRNFPNGGQLIVIPDHHLRQTIKGNLSFLHKKTLHCGGNIGGKDIIFQNLSSSNVIHFSQNTRFEIVGGGGGATQKDIDALINQRLLQLSSIQLVQSSVS